MKINYDKDVNCIYIKFSNSKGKLRQELPKTATKEDVVLDFDENDNLLGIEIIGQIPIRVIEEIKNHFNNKEPNIDIYI